MKRYLIAALVCWSPALFALIALAAAPPSPPAPSWNEHADLMSLVIGALIMLVCFFMLRTLKKIDRSQNRLYERLDALCKQVDTLQGEHNMMKNFCAGASAVAAALAPKPPTGGRPD